MSRMHVGVAGATGYLGTRVVAALRARGLSVTAIVRNAADSPALRELVALGATIAAVDAALQQSYDSVLRDADIAISCMASRNTGADPANDFWAIDRDANIRFGNAAVGCGVTQVILVATFEGPASRQCSEFSEAKEAAVDAIRLACQGAGISLTVVRPTAYFSDLTARACDSVAKNDGYTQIGDGRHRINPIDDDDVAELIRLRLEAPVAGVHDLPVGGPDILTFHEIGCLAAEVLGREGQLRFRTIPIGLLRFGALLAGGAGKHSRRMRRSAALLNGMIYAGTHDAVAPCVGTRRLRNAFENKRRESPAVPALPMQPRPR